MLRIVVGLLLIASADAAESPTVPLPVGWEQLDAEDYHGPEGWYHDSVSGAVVRYWTGIRPDDLGAGLSTGVPCVVKRAVGTRALPCLRSRDGRDIQIFIGPSENGVYASYWATIETAHQERRVTTLALLNPLATRPYSGHHMLSRDPLESDLRSVVVGMTIYQVLELLGDPVIVGPAAESGFVATYYVWGRWPGPNDKPTWASRTVKLTFTRDRLLIARPPNKRMQLTKLRAAPVLRAEVPPCAPAGESDGGTASQLIRGVGRLLARA